MFFKINCLSHTYQGLFEPYILYLHHSYHSICDHDNYNDLVDNVRCPKNKMNNAQLYQHST